MWLLGSGVLHGAEGSPGAAVPAYPPGYILANSSRPWVSRFRRTPTHPARQRPDDSYPEGEAHEPEAPGPRRPRTRGGRRARRARWVARGGALRPCGDHVGNRSRRLLPRVLALRASHLPAAACEAPWLRAREHPPGPPVSTTGPTSASVLPEWTSALAVV